MKRMFALACLLIAAGPVACARTETGRMASTVSPEPDASPADQVNSSQATLHGDQAPSAVPGCRSDEALLFGCRIARSGKAVALCTTPGLPPVTTYRFGDASHAELTFSDADASHANAFHRTPLTFAGATGGYVYSFRNGDVTYALYSIAGSEVLARAGVAVLDASSRKTADLECDPDSVQETESIDLIRRTRTWAQDPTTANVIR